MTNKIRILSAVVVAAAIVMAGMGAPAWADRLNIGAPAPDTGGDQTGPASARPKGTVDTTGPVAPVPAGPAPITVGSCATVLMQSPPAGVAYAASVVDAAALPTELPGSLVSCGIEVKATPGDSLAAVAEVCFAIPPTQGGFAYYWDGSAWVKTTSTPRDGQSCVEVPASAKNPAYAGLFDT